jgi:hypothetical protein
MRTGVTCKGKIAFEMNIWFHFRSVETIPNGRTAQTPNFVLTAGMAWQDSNMVAPAEKRARLDATDFQGTEGRCPIRPREKYPLLATGCPCTHGQWIEEKGWRSRDPR